MNCDLRDIWRLQQLSRIPKLWDPFNFCHWFFPTGQVCQYFGLLWPKSSNLPPPDGATEVLTTSMRLGETCIVTNADETEPQKVVVLAGKLSKRWWWRWCYLMMMMMTMMMMVMMMMMMMMMARRYILIYFDLKCKVILAIELMKTFHL